MDTSIWLLIQIFSFESGFLIESIFSISGSEGILIGHSVTLCSNSHFDKHFTCIDIFMSNNLSD